MINGSFPAAWTIQRRVVGWLWMINLKNGLWQSFTCQLSYSYITSSTFQEHKEVLKVLKIADLETSRMRSTRNTCRCCIRESPRAHCFGFKNFKLKERTPESSVFDFRRYYLDLAGHCSHECRTASYIHLHMRIEYFFFFRILNWLPTDWDNW